MRLWPSLCSTSKLYTTIICEQVISLYCRLSRSTGEEATQDSADVRADHRASWREEAICASRQHGDQRKSSHHQDRKGHLLLTLLFILYKPVGLWISKVGWAFVIWARWCLFLIYLWICAPYFSSRHPCPRLQTPLSSLKLTPFQVHLTRTYQPSKPKRMDYCAIDPIFFNFSDLLEHLMEHSTFLTTSLKLTTSS